MDLVDEIIFLSYSRHDFEFGSNYGDLITKINVLCTLNASANCFGATVVITNDNFRNNLTSVVTSINGGNYKVISSVENFQNKVSR